RRERFGNAVTHLEAVSPLATLARGYSVTSVSDGTVLKQTKQVKTGDRLTTRLKDGLGRKRSEADRAGEKRGPESLRPLNQRNKFHPFFRDQAMPMLAKVIHRAARLQHLQRLVAFRAAGLEGKHPFALGAM
ncbi:exodeoxyribonuclease VII large subunit, partial [Klebsiella pneumoniae]